MRGWVFYCVFKNAKCKIQNAELMVALLRIYMIFIFQNGFRADKNPHSAFECG